MAGILLVYPAPDEFKERRFGYSLDMLYLASILKKGGHRIVKYLDYSVETFEMKDFFSYADRADLIIFELDSFPLKRSVNIGHGERLVREVVKRYGSGADRKKKIILFGNDIAIAKHLSGENGENSVSNRGKPVKPSREPHNFNPQTFYTDDRYPYSPDIQPLTYSTQSPHDAIGREIEFDYALSSSFCNSIAVIVESIMKGDPVPELRPLRDLDMLPYPDRSLLTSYAEQGGTVEQKPGLLKSALIRTSVGCLNSCTFCQRKAWNREYLAHSIPYVSKEFSLLKENRYRNIWVTDDNFTFNPDRAKALLKELVDRRLTEGMKIAMSSWTRIDEEFLEIAKRARVSIISFGVETANREIQRFYRKTVDLERFGQLIRYADGIGLYTVGNFIIGAPMETGETIGETFSYIRETPFDRVNVKLLDYMAGSELYETLPPEKKRIGRHVFACKENGLNNFPLEVLRGKIKEIKGEFLHSREKHLKEKIKRYGAPYYLL